VLAEYERLDASELARRSILLAPSLTRILQFLETNGLVRRLSDKGDQRRALLVLTAKGKRLFGAIAPASEAIYAEMEQAFGAARMKLLYTLLADFHALRDDAPTGQLPSFARFDAPSMARRK
jgi:DNA-binding MarR family transcriptional regulator